MALKWNKLKMSLEFGIVKIKNFNKYFSLFWTSYWLGRISIIADCAWWSTRSQMATHVRYYSIQIACIRLTSKWMAHFAIFKTLSQPISIASNKSIVLTHQVEWLHIIARRRIHLISHSHALVSSPRQHQSVASLISGTFLSGNTQLSHNWMDLIRFKLVDSHF